MAQGSTVIFGSGSGKVVAVKAGAKEWELTVHDGQAVSALTVDGSWVYARSYPQVAAVRTDGNGGGGTVAWRYSTDGAVPGTPVIHGNLAYFLTSSREFVALDKTTGEKKKSLALGVDPSVDTLAIDPTMGAAGTAWFLSTTGLWRVDLSMMQGSQIHAIGEGRSAVTPPVILPDPRNSQDRFIWFTLQVTLPPPGERMTKSTIFTVKADGREVNNWNLDGQFYITPNLALRNTFVGLPPWQVEFRNISDSSWVQGDPVPQLQRTASGTLPVEDDGGVGGKVYVPGLDALVAMIRSGAKDGKYVFPVPAWISEAAGPMQTPVLDPNNADVYCANTYALYGINASDGKTKWSVAVNEGVTGTPVMLHAGSAAA
jgi:outer membrane protein assembly factor BamB